MARRRWPLAVYPAGFLVTLIALRMAFRMLDGGAPWPLAALVVAAGVALVLLLVRFAGRRNPEP
ncbi:hypothetical protein QNO00_05870 [Arthrobacter sp. zg-Y1219]|uniref:hypothetical protein n=1 Tax=Arthrobacter sp. zg-Y1219 TaxID=3049067 RepID=UPI0024C270B4|nr:hypothetical protein [Arthrobacter sp. zg-Y1219]MDK1359794.1 hypothetical protein [Arthrobacter sp. zg-Y1219]